MIKKSLILNYISQIILLITLFVIGSKFMHAFKLTLLIASGYLIYALTTTLPNNKDIKTYNYFYVAIIFIFALYASGFRSILYNNIVIELVAAGIVGLFLVIIMKNKEALRKKRMKSFIKEVRALEAAERIVREMEEEKKKREATKKTTVKKTAKKKVVKKTTAKKKPAKKVTKKKATTKKKPVKKKVVKKKK